jgi:murein DD-endopeptidase MepM/ murein hydrolase activator NlpD
MHYFIFLLNFFWLQLNLVWYWCKRMLTRLKLRRRGNFAESSFISLLLRPWLERDRWTRLVGAPLVASVILGSVSQFPSADATLHTWDISQPIQEVVPVSESPVVTEEFHYWLPTVNLLGISQFFHAGHPALDLRSPLGSDIVAVNDGVVVAVEMGTTGYGHYVILSHGNQMKTMYAHMGAILVTSGQFVRGGDALGYVGMTGLTTGPHLHFEVYTDDQVVNPLLIMREPIAEYQRELPTED